jgi:hypothetical protein
LAQRLNALNDPRALGSYLSGANRGRAGAVVNPVNPFFLQGAVGYMPVISTLPAGARMVVSSAVISADRRYVRVSPAPFFSGITQVNTFNFFTGASGTSNGATGGGGGSGGGGAGGGGFGGFGGGI